MLDGVLAELREVAAAVHVERAEVVARTRDWWAGSMIGETEGRPATPDAVVVEAADADQVAAVLRICHAAGVPVTPSAGRSNVTGAALPVFGGVVLDVCRTSTASPVSTRSRTWWTWRPACSATSSRSSSRRSTG